MASYFRLFPIHPRAKTYLLTKQEQKTHHNDGLSFLDYSVTVFINVVSINAILNLGVTLG